MRGGTLVNYVGLCERDDWQREGWSIRSSVAEVLREYQDWYADVRTIIAATPEHLSYKWALFDRDPLPLWVNCRVTLAADAAHPMLPFLGQGAAMGFEDAMVLARTHMSAESLGLMSYNPLTVPL